MFMYYIRFFLFVVVYLAVINAGERMSSISKFHRIKYKPEYHTYVYLKYLHKLIGRFVMCLLSLWLTLCSICFCKIHILYFYLLFVVLIPSRSLSHSVCCCVCMPLKWFVVALSIYWWKIEMIIVLFVCLMVDWIYYYLIQFTHIHTEAQSHAKRSNCSNCNTYFMGSSI